MTVRRNGRAGREEVCENKVRVENERVAKNEQERLKITLREKSPSPSLLEVKRELTKRVERRKSSRKCDRGERGRRETVLYEGQEVETRKITREKADIKEK